MLSIWRHRPSQASVCFQSSACRASSCPPPSCTTITQSTHRLDRPSKPDGLRRPWRPATPLRPSCGPPTSLRSSTRPVLPHPRSDSPALPLLSVPRHATVTGVRSSLLVARTIPFLRVDPRCSPVAYEPSPPPQRPNPIALNPVLQLRLDRYRKFRSLRLMRRYRERISRAKARRKTMWERSRPRLERRRSNPVNKSSPSSVPPFPLSAPVHQG